MARRTQKNDFPMTPDLESFKYEVAQEIGIANRLPVGKKQTDEMKAQGETGK